MYPIIDYLVFEAFIAHLFNLEILKNISDTLLIPK